MSRDGRANRNGCMSRCRWPHCRFRATTEIRRGPMEFIQLCSGHRPMWDLLSDAQLRAMEWGPKRKLARS